MLQEKRIKIKDDEESVTRECKKSRIQQSIPSKPCSVQSGRKPRVTFVLDKASLKLGVVQKTTKILNTDDHSNFLLKQNKNLDDFRPDILFQALLAIFDSPLRKAGMVEAIYVKIDDGVLFEVKPHTLIPRTDQRFYGLMSKLLQKSSITTEDTHEKLLRVIEQPVTRHLPANSRIIGLSYGSKKLVNLKDYLAAIGGDINLVFVVGAMAHGEIDKTYTDDFISVSNYALSASSVVGEICDALEGIHDII